MTQPLTVNDAVTHASAWIKESDLPIRSAFIGGSIVHADPDTTYDPASDVDCYLVVEGDPPEGKIGKITVNGVLLDVSWLPWEQLQSAESHAVLASLLHFGTVIRDDDGALSRLQGEISSRFTDEASINIRMDDMRNRIRNGLAGNSSHLAEPEQVMNWLFPATLATHIPLIAACAPLTVRKRFIAAKRVMEPGAYETLLSLYGFDDVTRDLAQSWLGNTAVLFDHTAPFADNSSRFWAGDIKADARPIAIGGSQQLIDAGLHREALYWIIATQARCLTVINDVGADTSIFTPAFRTMTASLGIDTAELRSSRTRHILSWVDNHSRDS